MTPEFAYIGLYIKAKLLYKVSRTVYTIASTTLSNTI